MKCKLTALICAIIMLLNTTCIAAFTDVNTDSDVGKAITELSALGILSGFGDGNFHPDETLTRAQFAKIAVCMLGEEKSAAARKSNVVFSDVAADNWASGYINYIAEREIINGYPDGTFGANDTINYAQALTILIRLLGYSGADVAYRWPEGYITKADALGITKNMQFGVYESLTRANAAYIVYNTLLSDKKENSSVSLLSAQSVEDVVIYGDYEIDASLENGNISTTKGTYKLAAANNITSSVYGRLGTLYIDAEGRATAFVPEKEIVREITIVSAAQNSDSEKIEITFKEASNTKIERYSAQSPIYYRGKTATLENAVDELEPGIEALLFFTEGGVFERIYLKESSLKGPITITSGYSQIYSEFNILSGSSVNVVRDGRNSSISEISMYDVVYYMESTSTVYAYTDKVTGVYEEAFPIKSNVKSVSIAGREYTLSSQKAIGKMNESEGSFSIGERVTLLFGRNGEVIDVVDMSGSGNLDIAVLTECYSEVSTDVSNQGERKRYTVLMHPDGTEATYETDSDYSNYIGKVMRVNYSGDKVKLSIVSNTSIYGEFNKMIPSLDGYWLSNDCSVLELIENGETAVVKKINVSDIQTNTLSKNQVIYAQRSGDMQDITFLYLQNITKSEAKFGVIIDKNANNFSVLADGTVKTVKTNLKLSEGSAVEINGDGTISALTKVGSGSSVSAYSLGRIRVGSQNYVVSDYVKIYGGRTASEYHTMSTEEILDETNVTNVTLFADKSVSAGGVVRVIIVRTKK